MVVSLGRILLVNLALLAAVQCEKFTALKDLENILHAEHGIAHDLKEYIKNEELRLQHLKRLADDFEEHSAEALQNPERHLGNPVNAFLLIKRFTTDWQDILGKLIINNATEGFLNRVNEKAEYFPDSEDLSGAAQALLRLQDTYRLDTTKIATGDLQGVKKSPVMTSEDCFELGRIAYNNEDHYHSVMWMEEALKHHDAESVKTTDRAVLLDYLSFSIYMVRHPRDDQTEQCFELGRHAYNQGDYYHTVLWMQEALQRWEQEDVKTTSKADILDYLSFAASMQGNPRRALNLTLEWLQLEPDHVRAQNNKKYFQQMIAEEEEERRRKGDKGPFPEDTEFKNNPPYDEFRAYKEFPIYEALCRGEETHDIPYKNKLVCRNKRHHPIFYLRPLHEEIMYLDPFIAVYHDLITDAEIAKVKELATPRLNRATVQNSQTGQLETANYRISKSAWLMDSEDKLIARLSQKSSVLANLTLETVEALQVLNYGIGGHYEPHYDFARERERAERQFGDWRGNRIATVIYYMTDVDAGGYTVFPEIGVKLIPRKGSCALWYNLKKNLEGDYRTRHAACPILAGTKWVCNKWFHERGQEFIRPCEGAPGK